MQAWGQTFGSRVAKLTDPNQRKLLDKMVGRAVFQLLITTNARKVLLTREPSSKTLILTIKNQRHLRRILRRHQKEQPLKHHPKDNPHLDPRPSQEIQDHLQLRLLREHLRKIAFIIRKPWTDLNFKDIYDHKSTVLDANRFDNFMGLGRLPKSPRKLNTEELWRFNGR